VTLRRLEFNDLRLSKAAAGRPKNVEFCLPLAQRRLVDAAVLLGRVDDIPDLTRGPPVVALSAVRRTGPSPRSTRRPAGIEPQGARTPAS